MIMKYLKKILFQTKRNHRVKHSFYKNENNIFKLKYKLKIKIPE
jgi:hypothetical protein